MTEMDIFFKGLKDRLVLFVHLPLVLNRLQFLGKNITIKILLAFMKILINSKDFTESHIRIIFWLRVFVTGRFPPVSHPHWMPENPRRFPVHDIGTRHFL